MLIYNHKDLDAYNNKRVFGSRVCRVPLIWGGLGWLQLDLLMHLLPAAGCLGSFNLAESVHMPGVGWLLADLGWPRLRWLGWPSSAACVTSSGRNAQTYMKVLLEVQLTLEQHRFELHRVHLYTSFFNSKYYSTKDPWLVESVDVEPRI